MMCLSGVGVQTSRPLATKVGMSQGAISAVTSSRSCKLLRVINGFTDRTSGLIATSLGMNLEGRLSGNLFKVTYISQGHKEFYKQLASKRVDRSPQNLE